MCDSVMIASFFPSHPSKHVSSLTEALKKYIPTDMFALL